MLDLMAQFEASTTLRDSSEAKPVWRYAPLCFEFARSARFNFDFQILRWSHARTRLDVSCMAHSTPWEDQDSAFQTEFDSELSFLCDRIHVQEEDPMSVGHLPYIL
jgi:hypothetical protein